MPLLVAALMCMCLCPTGYKVSGRRKGGGEGDLETPAPSLVIFTPGHRVWVSEDCYEKSLDWDFLGEGFYLFFPCLVILNSECAFL